MRALCGAIITAGALIGLGLTALGYGLRFHGVTTTFPEGAPLLPGTPSLILILVIMILAVLIGLGTAFLGLAFHHERRLREHLLHAGKSEPEARVPA